MHVRWSSVILLPLLVIEKMWSSHYPTSETGDRLPKLNQEKTRLKEFKVWGLRR